MKRILLALLAISSLALAAFFVPKLMSAIGTPNTGGAVNGVFQISADRVATLRFDFKLAQSVLFNRQGSSKIRFLNPFTGKNVAVEVSKGEPYPPDAADYLQRLDQIAAKLDVPEGAKAGVYNVNFMAEMFLCDGVLKICYREETPGRFEIRVAQSGGVAPVKLEYLRRQR